MNCANFLEYNPKIYIIFWNIIHKFVLFNGIAVYANPLVPLCLVLIDSCFYIPLHIDVNHGGRRGVWFRVLA